MSERKAGEFHREEDELDAGPIYVEYSPIDPWDDILHDGRIKYRTLADAYEAYRKERELREGQ
jgi:hypothetical protein